MIQNSEKDHIECWDTGETVLTYKDYLKTYYWENTRQRILNERGHTCERCGCSLFDKSFEVHHLSYLRLGDEYDDDLMLLCPECHKEVHRKEEK